MSAGTGKIAPAFAGQIFASVALCFGGFLIPSKCVKQGLFDTPTGPRPRVARAARSAAVLFSAEGGDQGFVKLVYAYILAA